MLTEEEFEEFLISLIETGCEVTVLDLEWEDGRIEILVSTDEDSGYGIELTALEQLGRLVASKDIVVNVAGPEALVVTVLNADIAPFLDIPWNVQRRVLTGRDN